MAAAVAVALTCVLARRPFGWLVGVAIPGVLLSALMVPLIPDAVLQVRGVQDIAVIDERAATPGSVLTTYRYRLHLASPPNTHYVIRTLNDFGGPGAHN